DMGRCAVSSYEHHRRTHGWRMGCDRLEDRAAIAWRRRLQHVERLRGKRGRQAVRSRTGRLERALVAGERGDRRGLKARQPRDEFRGRIAIREGGAGRDEYHAGSRQPETIEQPADEISDFRAVRTTIEMCLVEDQVKYLSGVRLEECPS